MTDLSTENVDPSSPNQRSTQDRTELLEQYKLFVEMTDRVSERRHNANTFFLGVNTLIVGMLGTLLGIDAAFVPFLALTLAIAGGILCRVWLLLIASYKSLNDARFKVINRLEQQLPAAPFDWEWDELGRGEDCKKHRPFTYLEKWIPWTFGGLYAIASVLHVVFLCL